MTACTGSTQLVSSTQPADWKQLPGVPISNGWEVADQPLVGKAGLLLVVHAMQITNTTTTLLYAATGSGVAEFADSATTILLHDEQGRAAKLIAQEIFDITLGGMKFGRLVFAERPFGAKELVLRISRDSGDKTILEGAVARLYGGTEDHFAYTNRTYSFNWWQKTDLSGYRIASGGWGAPPEQVAIPTKMLYPKEIESGEAATLRIEDLQSQQVYYLFMRFPSLHETKVVLIQ